MTKKCGLCGDGFTSKQKTQKYCNKKHYKKCPICGVNFLLKNNRDKKTCSNICAAQYRNSNIRYTLTCELCGKVFESKAKHAKFCDDTHYGKCEVCGERFEIQDIYRPSRTCSQSCASTLTHTSEARENRRLKSLKRHGTEYPFQSKEIVKKIRLSLDNSDKDMRIGSIRWKEMLNEKYGVNNISQVEEVKRIKEQTYYEKYGVLNPAAMQIKNYKDWNNFKDYVKPLNLDCLELSRHFETSVSSVRQKAYQTNSTFYIKDFYVYSEPELEVKHILTDLGLKEGVDFIPHNRSVIAPLELDFYLPKLNVAIEVSPTYTHNSKCGWLGDGEGKAKDYHIEKLKMCENKDVELITLFEWEDVNVIKGIINSKIMNNSMKEYEYKETMNLTTEIKKILDINHNTFKGRNYRITSIKNKTQIIAVFVWFEDIKTKTTTLKYYKYDYNVNINCLIEFVISNYTDTLKSKNVNKMTVISNSNVEIDSTYINAGFKLSKRIKPRLHYYHMRKGIHIKSNRLIYNNIDILENNDFLPVHDCGYKVWELQI